MKTLKELLDSNPVIKAVLYVVVAVCPEIIEALKGWESTPPASTYEVAGLAVRAVFAAAVTLKAFTSNPTVKPQA